MAEVAKGPGLEPAYRAAIAGGRAAFSQGDYALAARRFNQAYLLLPAGPEVYHGMAIVAQGRFRDAGFAEELFRTSLRLKPGDWSAQADYARFLLTERRFPEAVPLLEAVVADPQVQAMHFSNLGFAYAQTGQKAKACQALMAARSKLPPPDLQSDLTLLQKLAAC